MPEVVLDTSVLVGLLDENDSLHARATTLLERMRDDGQTAVLLDILVAEMVSVLCRRAAQRKTTPPDLSLALAQVRGWLANGRIRFVGAVVATRFSDVIDIVATLGGSINFNDGMLVLLQREAVIGDVASFDEKLLGVSGFHGISR